MTLATDKHIAILNELITTTLDSAKGYEEAADAAIDPELKHAFNQHALERRRLAADLQAEVRNIGGKPEDDGSTLGAAHRIFLNLKNTVAGSDASLIGEAESGENHVMAQYHDALAIEPLPPTARAVVARAAEAAKADQDKLMTMRHALRERAQQPQA